MWYMDMKMVVSNKSAYVCAHNNALLFIDVHFCVCIFSTDNHLPIASMLCSHNMS